MRRFLSNILNYLSCFLCVFRRPAEFLACLLSSLAVCKRMQFLKYNLHGFIQSNIGSSFASRIWYNFCQIHETLMKVFKNFIVFYQIYTQHKKCPYSEFFQVCIFPHSYKKRRDTKYLSIFSPNAGKCGQEKLRIRTLFTRLYI